MDETCGALIVVGPSVVMVKVPIQVAFREARYFTGWNADLDVGGLAMEGDVGVAARFRRGIGVRRKFS
jgi:hypothetical protein